MTQEKPPARNCSTKEFMPLWNSSIVSVKLFNSITFLISSIYYKKFVSYSRTDGISYLLQIVSRYKPPPPTNSLNDLLAAIKARKLACKDQPALHEELVC